VGIGHKPIEPLLDVAPDIPDELIGDGLRLQQILLNFISNAVKFTHQGEIVLTVQRHPPLGLADADGVRLQFSVRDTGIGMSDDTRKIIFNGFTQADASTSRVYGGTGLGLAISEQLATLMGGHITVSSTPGQGSEFSLTVTLMPVARAVRPVLPLHPLRLLVAEDNLLNQEVIEHILTQAGAQVVLAPHGQAAVAALQATGARFDAVLMDIQMPVMDGYAATHQIREVLGLLNLPIIAMTAHARPQDREKSRSAGMVGHLVKPLHVEELLAILVRTAGERVSSDFQVQ
jgi:CheY-like chemotaxis protein